MMANWNKVWHQTSASELINCFVETGITFPRGWKRSRLCFQMLILTLFLLLLKFKQRGRGKMPQDISSRQERNTRTSSNCRHLCLNVNLIIHGSTKRQAVEPSRQPSLVPGLDWHLMAQGASLGEGRNTSSEFVTCLATRFRGINLQK